MDSAVGGPPGDAVPDDEGAKPRARRPDWFHRDHPVFFPLVAFFTGMLYIILVPGTYTAILSALFDDERAEQLFPFVLLAFAVPIGLLVPKHTRRFGRYMLFGAVATLVVAGGVAALVLWILLKRDS